MTDYIYALLCPEGEIRYIGKTTNPASRLRAHISKARSGETKHHAANWIRSLLNRGEKPTVEVLLEVPEGEPWEPYEVRLISEFRDQGHRLTNSTGGGDGFFDLSAESMAKRVEAQKVTKSTPEFRERISAIMSEVRSSPEFRAAASARIKATWQNAEIRARYMAGMQTPEAKENRSKATRKRYEDPEQRALHAERSRKAAKENPEAFAAFLAASQSPEAKAKRRASLAKARAEPGYREKNLAALEEINARPEVKAKKAATAKANFAGGGLERCVKSEEFKSQQAERLKNRWKDPDAKKKIQEARWTDEHRAAQAAALEERREKMAAAITPEARARQGAKMKEYWARKRAEKAAKLAESNS